MTLPPGVRFTVAPHFHLDVDWTARLSLGPSIQPTILGPPAHRMWRPASADELGTLVVDAKAGEDYYRCLCLFGVPVHLRSAFWDLLAHAQEVGAISPERFNAFVADVARFLAFKQLPLPAGAAFELVLNRPGPAAPTAPSPAWGVINLGEDAASVMFLKTPERELPAPGDLPVRLLLGPGEGVRVPGGLLLGTLCPEEDQSDVLLLIRWPGRMAARAVE